MDVVLDELERTKAFERKTLVIIPTTGTGWVTPPPRRRSNSSRTADSALVAAQYSYMPSWISFVADARPGRRRRQRAVRAVHDRWLTKPGHPPQVVRVRREPRHPGGEGAFDGLADIRETVDGVLWVGPPNANPLWARSPSAATPAHPRCSR